MRIDTNAIKMMADALREYLGDDYDEQTFMDTMEGETDALEALSQLAKMERDASAMILAIRATQEELAARKERFYRRVTAARKGMKLVLDAMGQKKVELPEATISIIKGRQKLEVFEPAAIPDDYCFYTKTPNPKTIKAALEDGKTVLGAELVTGEPYITIRKR